MTKKHKQSSSNKSATAFVFGSMGRILFFTLALVIACCAVAVVLFETDAGQEFVAKVRGDVESPHGQDETGPSPSISREKKTEDFEGQGSEGKTENPANAAQGNVPDGDSPTPGTEKDTSSKVAEDFKEGDRTVEDTSRNEGAASDENKVDENTEEETFMDERAAETSHEVERDMENEGQKLDDEPAVGDVSGNEDSKVEEEEDEEMRKTLEDLEQSDEEDNAEHSDSDAETFDAEEPVSEETRDHVSDPVDDSWLIEPSVEDEEPSVEDETPKQDHESQQNEEQPLDDIDEEQIEEDTVSVGDSLTGLEEERVEDMKQTEEEEEEPLPLPEGPPIDEYPRHARRGLRGDYGSKDCKDQHVNCKAWADIGECKKNPIWMEVKCKRSCDVCGCSDNNLKCTDWLKDGECKKNYNYMNENCMKSCGQC